MSSKLQPLFAPKQLTAAGGEIFTGAAGATTQVQKFTLANFSLTTNYWVKVWLYPQGGVATDPFVILPQTTVLAGAALDVFSLIGQVLNAGDVVWAQAQADAAINCFGSGLVVTT